MQVSRTYQVEDRLPPTGHSAAIGVHTCECHENGHIIMRESAGITEEKQKLTELITRLCDVWGDAQRPTFDREEMGIEFPDRPGLY